MIVFDLKCSNGHIFEGWFDCSSSYKAQIDKDLISCPICEDKRICRVPSTFGIKSSPQDNKMPAPDGEMELLRQKVVHYIENNFDNVGSDFAKEALKIHYGVSEPRNIRGVSTEEEEKLMDKEGVQFVKIPIPGSPDADTNTRH